MKKRWLGVIGILCFGAAHGGNLGSGVSLEGAYQSALSKTEVVPILEVRAIQAEARIKEAKGTLFPNVSAIGGYLRQDVPQSPPSGFLENQTNARLSLTQPLFHGLRDFAALRSAEADQGAELAAHRQKRLQLYGDVSRIFLEVLTAEQDLRDLRKQEDLTQKRIQDIQSRVKIGRSRKSELLTSLSQEASLKVELKVAESRVQNARDQLVLVTGLARDAQLLDPFSAEEFKPKPLEEYLSQLEKRPDIEALVEKSRAAEEKTQFERGAHWPSLDLGGNYYLKRTGALENSKWDVGLTLTLPLFQGGVVSAKVNESTSFAAEQDLNLQLARRSAEADIRQAVQQVQVAVTQLELRKEGLTIAEKNYEEQSRDYRYGLSTNLDVLQALNALQENQRGLDRQKFQMKLSWILLKVATGVAVP